jgi:organic radical activating enzyme
MNTTNKGKISLTGGNPENLLEIASTVIAKSREGTYRKVKWTLDYNPKRSYSAQYKIVIEVLGK